jgi:chromosome segregation ATPase
MTAEQHLAALRSILDNLQRDIDASVLKLVAQRSTLDTSNKAIDEANSALEARRSEIELEKSTLRKTIEPLKTEEQRLITEVSALVTKKADLKLTNARLSEENAKFKTYESKAWKMLRAKEGSLLEREQIIEQKEGLKPNSKTLLPPIE